MTPLERAADAVELEMAAAQCDPVSIARAVLEAVRIPDEGMLRAATHVFSHFSEDGEYNNDFTEDQAMALFPALIDHILK